MYSVQKTFTSKAIEHFENFQSSSSSSSAFSSLQKSRSEVLSNRGFKPSDVQQDPQAKAYLTNLTKKVFHTDENRTKKIDLQKLFTPSTDFEEIKPGKNRKLYASSAFYAPGHPTVEDQVSLARRISHSLSDISNQKSKGQSMYINRKKRSVKWVHDANGKDISSYEYEGSSKFEDGQEEKTEKTEIMQSSDPKKVSLKFVMNPQGQMRDFGEIIEPSVPIMSPEPIINALNTTKEKGAELFAKRRKKSDKWIVDEMNSEKFLKSSRTTSTKTVEQMSSSLSSTTQSTIESISKSINDMTPITPVLPKPDTPTYIATSKLTQSPTIIPYSGYGGLAYRPRVPQGWNAPPIKLQIEIDEKMDEDKENTLPQMSVAEEHELMKDEQEIMDIYDDSSRHIEYIKEEAPVTKELVLEEPPALSFPTVDELKREIIETSVVEHSDEEEYQKVSVRDLVSTFESFQHKEKVHVRKDQLIKEPSTESEISEVPKLIQLFTGQPATPVADSQLQNNDRRSVPKQERKRSTEKVSSETQTPTTSFTQAQDAEPISDTKLEETISEFECQIQNMFESKVMEQKQQDSEAVESYGPTLPPVAEIPPPPSTHQQPEKFLLAPPQKPQRDAAGNVSPLPYVQNTQSLPPNLNFTVPEPEIPEPDFSYEAFLSNPTIENCEIPEPPRLLSLTSLTNYNTAPRGWGLAKDFYRPIHLGKKFDNLVYSDF